LITRFWAPLARNPLPYWPFKKRMQAVVFYLVYPILYLVASLPFGALYKLSDFFYFLLKLSGYRRGIVLENLRNSFPEKNG